MFIPFPFCWFDALISRWKSRPNVQVKGRLGKKNWFTQSHISSYLNHEITIFPFAFSHEGVCIIETIRLNQ